MPPQTRDVICKIMEKEKIIKISKGLIFISGTIAAIIAIYTEMISGKAITNNDIHSPFMVSLGLLISGIFICGLFLGSRAIGEPLTIKRFFQLLFGFPCLIPIAMYIVAMVVVNTF